MQLNPEQAKTLYDIFTPHASSRREEMLKNESRLVHYTSAESALKILQSKELWLRNARAMEDFTEVGYGYQHLLSYFSTDLNKDKFYEALNFSNKNLGQEGFKLFDSWWGGIQNSSFISCFSEHDKSEDDHGRLSMWRGFGQSANGVALIFKFPRPADALPTNVFLTPVEYRTVENMTEELGLVTENIKANQKFLDGLEDIAIIGAIYVMLMTLVVSSKHPGFHEEREWRLVHSPLQNPSIHTPRSLEVIKGTPQLVHKVILKNSPQEGVNAVEIADMLDGIIIGPAKYPDSIREAFVHELMSLGVRDPSSKVRVSGIPVRV